MENPIPKKAPRVPPGRDSLAAAARRYAQETLPEISVDPLRHLNDAACKLEGLEELLEILQEIFDDIQGCGRFHSPEEGRQVAKKAAERGFLLMNVAGEYRKLIDRSLRIGEGILFQMGIPAQLKALEGGDGE